MPLPQLEQRTPTTIADISIQLTDYIAGVDQAEYSIQVLDQDGLLIKVLTGDLTPHLTGVQKIALQDFMSAIRAQAEAEILP